jgi:hypothetical protein
MPRAKKEILPPEHCASVKEYEASPWWKKKSQEILDNKDVVCEICSRRRWEWMPRKKKWKKRRFSLHHSDYSNCPNELPSELHPLCSLCHSTAHDILRYQNIGTMFKRMAEVVKEYFFYEGIDSFKGW